MKENIKSKIGRNGELGALPYSSKIIKAGALLADAKTFFSAWDPELSVTENIDRIRHQNLLAKTSRSRADDIVAIFRQRYLSEEAVTRALSTLVKCQSNGSMVDRILYFHSARADALLKDVVINVLAPQRASGNMEVDVFDIEHALKKWIREGKMASEWGDHTIRRVSQGLLSTLRDFGVLEGAVNKQIAPALLPVHAFAYIMFFLKQHQPSGAKLIDLPDWKLFFLSSEGVERFLFEAHQRELLEYHAAGIVARLTFPATTMEEYANVLAERAN